jgi:streptomycin 6-kinase
MGSTGPDIDANAPQRLRARFGGEVETWFDELPGVLTALARRWQFEFGPPIPRGSVSAVFRCRMADGRRAVLKASPDRARLAFEAAALGACRTVHVPAVIALDEQLGALLIEAIEPGTPLVLSAVYPAGESVAELLCSLHQSCVPDSSYPTVGQRVANLFNSSAKLYERHPELTASVPPALYERRRDRHGRGATSALGCGVRGHERPGNRQPSGSRLADRGTPAARSARFEGPLATGKRDARRSGTDHTSALRIRRIPSRTSVSNARGTGRW